MDNGTDIIAVDADGNLLLMVEVEPDADRVDEAVQQLARSMRRNGATTGLVVAGDQVRLLRETFVDDRERSIVAVASATLPDTVLPVPDERWRGVRGVELASSVQSWLESIHADPTAGPDDLVRLVEAHLRPLLAGSEIRAAGPRWLQVAG